MRSSTMQQNGRKKSVKEIRIAQHRKGAITIKGKYNKFNDPCYYWKNKQFIANLINYVVNH